MDPIFRVESIRMMTKVNVECLVQNVVKSSHIMRPQSEVVRLSDRDEIAVHCDDFLGLASWIIVSEGGAWSCPSGHCKQTVVVEDPIQAVESLFVLLS